MSKYTIKSYQEEFLEAQEQVGKEVTKDWKGFGQTPASRLKQIYAQKGFDPETKYYAFQGDKLVGFITSTILPENEGEAKRANLEFPIVLKEHKECIELLFSQAVASLKKKGVKIVQTRVGDIYKGTHELAKKFGYNYAKDQYILLEVKTKNISSEESSDINVVEYEYARDSEQCKQIFVEKFGYSEEYAKASIDRIEKEKERFPIHLVIREDDNIVGRALAYPNTNNPKEFNLSPFYFENEKFFKPLVEASFSKIKSFGIESVNLFLFGPTLSSEEKYLSIGFFRAGKIDYYEKEI
ncbi:MAG: hypothetical protein JXA54_12635 [Candidatus Heimdallarchaeota archaeon]|nr:hypothetical protein [Candidatus Heimdallarchaeota archaeon]